MRYLPILILATASLSLAAQTAASNTAAQASTPAASASFVQSSSVSAQLTKKVDTKNAKVGDEVVAKTTSNAQLTDGTRVPKGTKLVGQVTEVRARSGAEKTSHLAFAMNKAILRDGREIPMHATLTSVSAPTPIVSDETGTDDLQKNPAAIGNGGSRGGGGGLLAGTARTTQNVAGSGTSAFSNTTNSMLRANSNGAPAGMGAVAAVPGPLNHAAVSNMPGVSISSAVNSTSSGSLDAIGKNIALENGTQMTMQVGVN